MKKYNIEDYAEQLQQLCGVSNTYCPNCMKRAKNTSDNFCVLKRVAFSLSKQKLKQQEKERN